jgi:glyoxalase family protein
MERDTIAGFHHITAIVGHPQENIDFYTQILGLRLIKQTVNFDDPGTYHLYYGDETGTPGTIITFFPWPDAQKGRRGTGQVTAIAFALAADALDYWVERLKQHNVEITGPTTRFNERVISFLDPHGLALELVAHQDLSSGKGRTRGPIPEPYAIQGFSGTTMSEAQQKPTHTMLTEVLGFRLHQQEGNRYRYTVGTGGPGSHIDILHLPNEPHGRIAVGTVHHIAWRTEDDAHQLAWRSYLLKHNSNVTPVLDRRYFHSIYFNEPGGILFEIATNPPGFTADESVTELGTHLKLPPWLETQRAEIEATLLPIHIPENN